MNNIKNVGNDCSLCGLCTVVCPKQCIKCSFCHERGDFVIEVDERLCIDCGLCNKICHVKNSSSSSFVDETKNAIVFASYCKDLAIRKDSASGGFITGFLCFLMDNKLIDGALVSRRNGISGQSFIAKTKEEIVASKTSIYAPVDYANGLKELEDTDCTQIVVVGLPCHINAINNWRKVNKQIDKKVILTVSIICGKTPTEQAYRYIANNNHFNYCDIQSVKNRGDGWPGYMSIVHKDGEYKVPYRSDMSMGMVLSSPLLCREGCLSCLDGYGNSADFVVCDAWSPTYTETPSEGWSFVLAKTAKAVEYLNHKNISDWLYLNNDTVESFYKANKRVIDKHILNNYFRQVQYRYDSKTKLTFKHKLYVAGVHFLKNVVPLKKADKLSAFSLMLGKMLNKLKD